MGSTTLRLVESGTRLVMGENTAEAARSATRAEIAAGALNLTTLTVVKAAGTIDIYTAELLPLSNRYVRTRMQRIIDAGKNYDAWRVTGSWLARRTNGAFEDIVQISEGQPDVMAREFGKTARMGDGAELENVTALFLADGRRLGNAASGTFECRTLTLVQNGQMFEADTAVPNSRARVRTQRTFTAFGQRFDFEIALTSEAWSIETLEVGNLRLIEGSGPTFASTLSGPNWVEDTFPPFYTDYPEADTFLFYGPQGVMVKMGLSGDRLEGSKVTIDGDGDISVFWKNEPFAPATSLGSVISGAVTYDHAWEAASSTGVKSPVGAVSAFMRTLFDDPDAATARDTLGLGSVSSSGSTTIASGALRIGTATFLSPSVGTGRLYASEADGLVIAGSGSTTDLLFVNRSGNTVADVAVGTTLLNIYGGLRFKVLPDDFADDAAASAGGMAVGRVYLSGSFLKVRVA